MAVRKRLFTLIISFLLLALLAGCKKTEVTQTDQSPNQELRRILFVTDDVGAKDSALCWKLLQECAAKAQAQVTLLEVQYQADKASTALNQASEGLYDVVILDRLLGETATEWVRRNAGYYPEVSYLCLDVAPEELPQLNNVTWLLLDESAVYYFYGAMAALNSQSGTIAFWGAENGIRSENLFLAFYTGARQISPHIRALYFSSSRTAGSQEMQTTLNTVMEEQADVLCCQTGGDAAALLSLLDAGESSMFVLVGGTELTIEQLRQQETVLACSWFDVRTILVDLFDQCCTAGPTAELQRRTWSSGDIRLRRGVRYPGELSAESVELQRQVEQDARNGKLDTLLSAVLSDEERQQKIALAGNKGDTN